MKVSLKERDNHSFSERYSRRSIHRVLVLVGRGLTGKRMRDTLRMEKQVQFYALLPEVRRCQSMPEEEDLASESVCESEM